MFERLGQDHSSIWTHLSLRGLFVIQPEQGCPGSWMRESGAWRSLVAQ